MKIPDGRKDVLKNNYRPAYRHAVENKQTELRKMIRDALTQKVKE
jgi:hypothetical protein